jgi:hypothetical protein
LDLLGGGQNAVIEKMIRIDCNQVTQGDALIPTLTAK